MKSEDTMKTVVVLGAGLVTGPLVRYLLDRPDLKVEVADVEPDKAASLVAGHPRGSSRELNIRDEILLDRLVEGADLIISMVPYVYHPLVARRCIARGKNMVTASYVGPSMKDLDAEARRRGVLILNELGLDPGIDHMEALRVIRGVKSTGGRVRGFVSYCGGLPASEANTNPIGYKFSWSPLGVLLASKNAARYLCDGRIVEVPAEELFDHPARIEIPGLGLFEGYPNRDAMPYIDTYGIPETETMLRGTLRYPGWCAVMRAFNRLGFMDQKEKPWPGGNLRSFFLESAGLKDAQDPRRALEEALGPDREVLDRIEWLGLLDDKPLSAGSRSVLDVLAECMIERLRYDDKERDMTLLQHEFLVEYPKGKSEKITSTLLDYGVPGGDSAMSRTVGLPVGVAAALICDGSLRMAGVRIPTEPEIYEPVLRELQRFGIAFREKREETSGVSKG